MGVPFCDLFDLRLLAGLRDRGSFSAAGRALSISQPAASRRFRLMEQRAHAVFFHAAGRGVELTEEGDFWARVAREVASTLDDAGEEFAARFGQVDDADLTETCWTSPALGAHLLSDWVHSNERRNAATAKPHIRIASSGAVLRAVEVGQAYFGLVERSRPVLDELRWIPLAKDRLVLIVGREDPLGDRRRIDWSDLSDLVLIGRESDSWISSILQETLHELGLRTKEPAISVDSLEVAKWAVLKGFGSAVVPASAVSPEVGSGAIREVEISNPSVPLYVFGVFRSDRKPHSFALSLMECIRANASLSSLSEGDRSALGF